MLVGEQVVEDEKVSGAETGPSLGTLLKAEIFFWL